MTSLADLRREYASRALTEADALDDPIQQFSLWFGEALKSELLDTNAMTLATATPSGEPSARIVLLKGFDEAGFVFFTNYESAKGRVLADNPRASLLMFWAALERQVRITGQRHEDVRRRIGELLSVAPVRKPDRRLGLGAKPHGRRSRGARIALCRAGGQVRRRSGAAAAVLGRLPRRARPHRILAGTQEPAARSVAVYATGWLVVAIAPGALKHTIEG